MSLFKQIDAKLEQLSNKLGANLTKDRPEYPEALRTFEERRIDWEDSGILKAIIIQPTFKISGVDSKIWNFINFAWYYDKEAVGKKQWMKIWVEKKKFSIIESNIDDLLFQSEQTLLNIVMADLK
ncbi:MAG: hypothetical protein ACI8ZM_001302 [Crocinitomix sp.]|jgi:hypothetical protein